MKITDPDLRLVERVKLSSEQEREAFRQRHLAHGAHVDEEGNLLCEECDTIWFTLASFEHWGPFPPMGSEVAEDDGEADRDRVLSGAEQLLDVYRGSAKGEQEPQNSKPSSATNPFLED